MKKEKITFGQKGKILVHTTIMGTEKGMVKNLQRQVQVESNDSRIGIKNKPIKKFHKKRETLKKKDERRRRRARVSQEREIRHTLLQLVGGAPYVCVCLWKEGQ